MIAITMFYAVCEMEGIRRFTEILNLKKAGECEKFDELFLYPVYSIQCFGSSISSIIRYIADLPTV